jgi:hypothetical protein
LVAFNGNIPMFGRFQPNASNIEHNYGIDFKDEDKEGANGVFQRRNADSKRMVRPNGKTQSSAKKLIEVQQNMLDEVPDMESDHSTGKKSGRSNASFMTNNILDCEANRKIQDMLSSANPRFKYTMHKKKNMQKIGSSFISKSNVKELNQSLSPKKIKLEDSSLLLPNEESGFEFDGQTQTPKFTPKFLKTAEKNQPRSRE